MSLEVIYALITIVIIAILIFFLVKAENAKNTYTVYVSHKTLVAINAYREAWSTYDETVFPMKTRKRVLRQLRNDVPNVYQYLLDESRIEVKLYGEELHEVKKK